MDFTGRICEVSRDYITRKPMIKFLINENPDGIEDFDGKDLKIKVVKSTNPRSLNANAYFHVLCDKLRLKLGMSMAAMKNILITRYGQIEYLSDGVPLCYKTNAPVEYILELEDAHMKFKRMSDDGAYMYIVYRGSHTYNTEEMSRLLEGTIQDAQEQGIETKTPDEIARLAALWGQQKGVKNDAM